MKNKTNNKYNNFSDNSNIKSNYFMSNYTNRQALYPEKEKLEKTILMDNNESFSMNTNFKEYINILKLENSMDISNLDGEEDNYIYKDLIKNLQNNSFTLNNNNNNFGIEGSFNPEQYGTNLNMNINLLNMDDFSDINKIKAESAMLFNSNSNILIEKNGLNLVKIENTENGKEEKLKENETVISHKEFHQTNINNNNSTNQNIGNQRQLTNSEKFKVKIKEMKANTENYLEAIKRNFINYVENQKSALVSTLTTIESIFDFPTCTIQQEEEKNKSIEKKMEDFNKEVAFIMSDFSKFSK